MNRCLHVLRNGAFAIALAAALAHCGGSSRDGGGGGGGGNPVQLFFGINGEGTCSSVTVIADLADANAVLDRLSSGAPNCSIDGLLASRGCNATFTVIGDDEQLRATVSGCTIPAVTNLFQCFFDEVSLFGINSESIAQCACTTSGCDGSPPLCIDGDPDPRSCEDCDNRIDDDENGLEDCEDPNCIHSPQCAITTTTTSDTLPSTTSTSLGATTTTSLPPGPIEINFNLDQTVEPLGALQFTVNYTSAPGAFVGDGEQVACTPNVDAVFAKSANDATSKLTLGFVSLEGMDDPQPLATCLFDPDTPVPVPANFTVVIDDAADLEGERVRNVIVGVTVTGVPED
jgi:hypothetical protein